MHLVVLLYALFATVFTISKTGLQYAQPVFFVGARMFFAGAVLLTYLFFRDRSQFSFNKSTFWLLIRLAAFNIYLTNIFEFWGLQYLTSFKTCFIYSLSPFLSALFSYLMLSENMSSRKWMGLLVGFIGFFPILLHETAAEESLGHLLVFSWAEVAVMGAAVCSVYGWILLRKAVNEGGVTFLMANGVSMAAGGAMALVHSFFTESWNPVPVSAPIPFMECAILLVLISNLTCYNLYGHLLKKFTATFMSFAGFTTPLFTALFGWFFLGEIVSWPFYVSSLIVLAGLFLFYQEELKYGYTLTPQVS